MDIGIILNDLIKYGISQEFINRRFKSLNLIPLPYRQIRLLELDDGSKFPVHDIYDLVHFLWVREEYRFEDIQSEDIVIDLGANIGGFCIQSSKLSNHVFAVEPLFADKLRENIILNHVDVTVIEAALGKGNPLELGYQDRKKIVQTIPFSQIKKMAGGCDFLKCDCEGAEHLLTPEDLKGVRRIEMEVHRSPTIPWNYDLFEFIQQHYECTCDQRYRIGYIWGILHAKRR
jgi:FkbM family methyltransferase